MKALRIFALSALIVILLAAPGYTGTTYWGSGNSGLVLSSSGSHVTYVPVHDRYYHNGYRWDHERYWHGRYYRPYGYYYRPYVYRYGYYRPYYYPPYAYVQPAPGFSIYLGF